MACGNNKVTRDYLSSQPSSSTQQGQRLFNETARAEGKVRLQDSRGNWITPARKYTGETKEPDGRVTVHRFLDENRNATLNTDLHIHVIHQPNGDVDMHITDRRGGGPAKQSDHTPLKQASGNKVNAAEQRLAAIMRDMKG